MYIWRELWKIVISDEQFDNIPSNTPKLLKAFESTSAPMATKFGNLIQNRPSLGKTILSLVYRNHFDAINWFWILLFWKKQFHIIIFWSKNAHFLHSLVQIVIILLVLKCKVVSIIDWNNLDTFKYLFEKKYRILPPIWSVFHQIHTNC